MPQMAPMMWLMLFFIFILTFLMFNILNYFHFCKLNENYSKKNNNILNNTLFMNWKW